MQQPNVREYSDEDIMKIAGQLRIAYQLKRTLRYSTARDVSMHSESVAEHVFALFFLAEYFLPLEDPNKELNREVLYRMMLFHDFGEIINGDVPTHLKTPDHSAQEAADANAVFDSLPEALGTVARTSWRAYETLESLEARFAYALDKVEPLFELLDPVNELSMQRLKFTYKDHLAKKIPATEEFPVMRRFVEAMSKDMLSRKVFWEEAPTIGSK